LCFVIFKLGAFELNWKNLQNLKRNCRPSHLHSVAQLHVNSARGRSSATRTKAHQRAKPPACVHPSPRSYCNSARPSQCVLTATRRSDRTNVDLILMALASSRRKYLRSLVRISPHRTLCLAASGAACRECCRLTLVLLFAHPRASR
jgi:hypothetical protein